MLYFLFFVLQFQILDRGSIDPCSIIFHLTQFDVGMTLDAAVSLRRPVQLPGCPRFILLYYANMIELQRYHHEDSVEYLELHEQIETVYWIVLE